MISCHRHLQNKTSLCNHDSDKEGNIPFVIKCLSCVCMWGERTMKRSGGGGKSVWWGRGNSQHSFSHVIFSHSTFLKSYHEKKSEESILTIKCLHCFHCCYGNVYGIQVGYVMVAQVISHRDIWIESQGNSEDPMANEGKVLHCPRKQRLVRQLIPLSTTHTLSVDNLLRYPSWRSFRLHTLCLASFPVRHLVQILSIYNSSSTASSLLLRKIYTQSAHQIIRLPISTAHGRFFATTRDIQPCRQLARRRC